MHTSWMHVEVTFMSCTFSSSALSLYLLHMCNRCVWSWKESSLLRFFTLKAAVSIYAQVLMELVHAVIPVEAGCLHRLRVISILIQQPLVNRILLYVIKLSCILAWAEFPPTAQSFLLTVRIFGCRFFNIWKYVLLYFTAFFKFFVAHDSCFPSFDFSHHCSERTHTDD